MRPPLKAAHQHATKELVRLHNEQWQELVNAHLAEQGWAQEEEIRHVWRVKKPDETGE